MVHHGVVGRFRMFGFSKENIEKNFSTKNTKNEVFNESYLDDNICPNSIFLCLFGQNQLFLVIYSLLQKTIAVF